MSPESMSLLSKSRVQEPDGDSGQDSRPLCLWLGRNSDTDHDPRHMVTSPLDDGSLAEPSRPRQQVAERTQGRNSPG